METEICIRIAEYMIETQCSIRQAAAHFGVSKSTVHYELHNNLRRQNKQLYEECKDLLNYNWSVKHIRGGQSTARKYAVSKSSKRSSKKKSAK